MICARYLAIARIFLLDRPACWKKMAANLQAQKPCPTTVTIATPKASEGGPQKGQQTFEHVHLLELAAA